MMLKYFHFYRYVCGFCLVRRTLHFVRGSNIQDAVMFSSTLQFNLDPFDRHSDAELWEVLDTVQIKDAVTILPRKLQELVADGGANFSVGQRQVHGHMCAHVYVRVHVCIVYVCIVYVCMHMHIQLFLFSLSFSLSPALSALCLYAFSSIPANLLCQSIVAEFKDSCVG